MAYYQYQIFFCTNLRQSGKQCCANADAQAMFEYMKQRLKKLGLHGPSLCRANTCSCLGRCEEGPVLVIYPQGVWYTYHTQQDIDDIIEQHLMTGHQVERLLLPSIK